MVKIFQNVLYIGCTTCEIFKVKIPHLRHFSDFNDRKKLNRHIQGVQTIYVKGTYFVLLRLVIRPKPQLVLLQHFNDGGGVGGEHCAGHDGVVRLDRLPKIVTVAAHRRKLGVVVVRVPNVDVAVFRTAHNIFTVVAKASFDLTAHVHVTCQTGTVKINGRGTTRWNKPFPLYLHETFRSRKSYSRMRLSFDVTKILSSPGIGSIPLTLRPIALRPLDDLT